MLLLLLVRWEAQAVAWQLYLVPRSRRDAFDHQVSDVMQRLTGGRDELRAAPSNANAATATVP